VVIIAHGVASRTPLEFSCIPKSTHFQSCSCSLCHEVKTDVRVLPNSNAIGMGGCFPGG
jgi:hypothetical protein